MPCWSPSADTGQGLLQSSASASQYSPIDRKGAALYQGPCRQPLGAQVPGLIRDTAAGACADQATVIGFRSLTLRTSIAIALACWGVMGVPSAQAASATPRSSVRPFLRSQPSMPSQSGPMVSTPPPTPAPVSAGPLPPTLARHCVGPSAIGCGPTASGSFGQPCSAPGSSSSLTSSLQSQLN